MRTIFEACAPRDDVLKGALTEDTFAADLQAVTGQTAPAVYRDPQLFFQNSYPTEGLKTLTREVLGRFTGASSSSPVLRLETSFGGGKTHNLIALWHMAKNPQAAKSGGWIGEVVFPATPLSVVALSGDKYGADEVGRHDQVITRTLWGEVAWQLGRYQTMQASDDERLVPSEATLDAIIGGKQVLILIDEFAAYLRGARGKKIGDGTLADQSLRFFHMLLGYAASHDNVVVVYTLAESTDAYATETDRIVEQVRESRALSARQERVITPTSEVEISEILKRRLFKAIDQAIAGETAASCSEYLTKAYRQGAPLPLEATDVRYRQRIERSYPFHPEFINTLYRKTASISNFQRTRGVLRLLAAVVRSLWAKRPVDAYLIQSTDVDLSEASIRNDLTSRLDRARLDVAVSADIWSEHGNAHAQEFDREWALRGHPGLCTRVAQAVFLHSLVAAKEASLGGEPSEVFLASMRPGLPFDLVEKTLGQIDGKFWYAEFDGKRYYFKEEPTLKKLIEEAASSVGSIEAKDALRKKLREVFSGTVFGLPVFFPSGPQDIPDESGKPTLVVMDFDHIACSALDQETPKVMEDVFRLTGESLNFRQYQNNLIVLACDRGEHDRLVEMAKRFKGIEALNKSDSVKQQLPKNKVKELKEIEDRAALEYLVAVTNAYRHLFFPSTVSGGVEHYQMPPQDTNGAKRQQQTVLRNKLIELKQALADGSGKLAPEYINDKVWTTGDDITVLELERMFRRKPRVFMLFDTEPIRETIKSGVEAGLWVFHNGETTYRKQNPPLVSAIRFDNDCTLLTAARADLLFPVTATKPEAIGTPGVPGGHGGLVPGEEPTTARDVPRRLPVLEATGAVAKAFVEIRDRLGDAGLDTISSFALDVFGYRNTKGLIYAWPAFATANAALYVTHHLTVKVADDLILKIDFEGPGKYFQRIKPAIETATIDYGETTDYIASTQVRLVFKSPLTKNDPWFDQMKDILISNGFDEVTVIVEAAKEGQ